MLPSTASAVRGFTMRDAGRWMGVTALSPNSETEAAVAIADAQASCTPLLIEGGGTKSLVGRPAQSGRTLTSRGLTGITLHESAELVIAARAGTPLADIVRALDETKQQLSFEPMDHRLLLGSEGEPTIGAVAATNLSGPRRINAGAARDSLIGVRFVNGRGEVVKSGGRVMKNVTGLDLVKLMAGSWGTLGFLTEVTFKVVPKPERAATLVLPGLDDRRAVAALAAALGSPFELSGAAHLPACGPEPARTLMRIEGFDFAVEYRQGELRRLLKRFGAADLLPDEAAADLWRAVRDVTPLAQPRDRAVWRISTAPMRGPDVVEAVSRTLDARRFYDWGGGLVWLSCDPAGDAGASAVRAAVRAFGGHATLIRAPVEVRAAVDVFEPMDDALRRVTAGVKASFDPSGVLNPGRMHAGT